VIDGAAAAAEHILFHAPGARLLATSRESLRIQGEWVQRLEALSLPPPSMQNKAADALAYSAVKLFVERAAAGASTFVMDDEATPLVCSICRRLDGIPLAIELAAGAIDVVGLKGLVERLGGRLGKRLVMIGRGRRTASPRQQTLRATLDWSHDLLAPQEQELLAHLSIFRGVFTHDAASAVFDQPLELLDSCLASLLGKSMVVSERTGDMVVYRLLETTREYAGERLAASASAQTVALRHARHILLMVRSFEHDGEGDPRSYTAPAPARWIDDLREAVHWSLASDDTRRLGISLMAWSAPLWFSLSMLAEYRRLAERALECIAAEPQPFAQADEEMRLCEALGHALWHTRGGGDAMGTAFGRALVIAERLQATAYRLRCRWGLWLVCNAEGDYAGSLRLAEEFGDIAASRGDPAHQRTFERMMALGAHFQGNQATAGAFAERVLAHSDARPSAAKHSGFLFDQRVAAHTVMARVLWLQGKPVQALAHAEEAVQQALAIDHALSLCYAIAIGAAPVAFWCGDTDKARVWSGLLKRRSDERSLHFWQAYGNAYQHLLDIQDGQALPSSLAGAAGGTALGDVLSTVHSACMGDALLARAQSGASGWCAAELLRIAGERHVQAEAWDDAAALFERGIALARQQHALAWELRCMTSLARVLAQQERRHEARHALESVLQRFHEGHDTQDLRIARDLIDRELQ
jgi:predicted ATPase